MSLGTMIRRSLAQTGKQIRRSGWMAWASVLIMTLSLFIASVFLMLAYTSNLFLQSIENKPHIYVFFNPGTAEENIQALNDSLLQREEILMIEYTNEEGALSEFKSVQERTNPQVAENIRDNVLPASLGIRLVSIEDAQPIIDLLLEEEQTNEDIFTVRFSEETIETIKSLFQALRLGGGIIMTLLLIVIFLFTLLTVEFRTFSRQEEIGIMQLVGGSVWFIRMPFILEGAVYGILGSLISTSLLYGLGYFIFIASRDSNVVTFIVNYLGNLQWPDFSAVHFIALFIIMLLVGGFIGMFNGLIAIRRHIK